jgi:hypothetical protein
MSGSWKKQKMANNSHCNEGIPEWNWSARRTKDNFNEISLARTLCLVTTILGRSDNPRFGNSGCLILLKETATLSDCDGQKGSSGIANRRPAANKVSDHMAVNLGLTIGTV